MPSRKIWNEETETTRWMSRIRFRSTFQGIAIRETDLLGPIPRLVVFIGTLFSGLGCFGCLGLFGFGPHAIGVQRIGQTFTGFR